MPQVTAPWTALGSFVLAAVLLVTGSHVLLGVYLSAAALAVLPALLVLGLPVRLLPRRWRAAARHYAALGLAVLVATVFLMLAASFLAAWLDVTWLKRLARHPFYLFAVCAVPALAAIVARRGSADIAGRTEQLGLLLLGAAVAGLVLKQALPRGACPAPEPGKHLLLMILDGMPSQHLHSYRPAAPVGPLDRLAASGLLMTQARTAATWTYAYFGALYSGTTEVVEAPRDRTPGGDSLIGRLQRGGVSARWMSYHRNGMPEGSAAHASDYRGLRSYLLTADTAWVPRLLNLDYHLAIANPGISQNLRGAPGRALFDWLNGGRRRTHDNILTERLLPLLREQRGTARDTFTLFHTGWNGTGGPAEEARAQLPRAQEIVGLENIARDATQTIRDNDYRYGPELEPLAEKHRRGLALSMVDLGVHLTDFMAALAADDTLRDTVVIVTADHGSMYTKGRFWYGFHPNEEVTLVPLLIFNAGRTGRDDRLVGTLDIGASVLGFFGLARESDAGSSVFADHPDRARTHTLTLRSDRNKEWFWSSARRRANTGSTCTPRAAARPRSCASTVTTRRRSPRPSARPRAWPGRSPRRCAAMASTRRRFTRPCAPRPAVYLVFSNNVLINMVNIFI